jgi:hypothetical protein
MTQREFHTTSNAVMPVKTGIQRTCKEKELDSVACPGLDPGFNGVTKKERLDTGISRYDAR